jgi:hypothetical protein
MYLNFFDSQERKNETRKKTVENAKAITLSLYEQRIKTGINPRFAFGFHFENQVTGAGLNTASWLCSPH